MSRSVVSPTTTSAPGGRRQRFRNRGGSHGRGRRALGSSTASVWPVVASRGGLGVGLTNSAWYAYSTRNERKMAMRTRLSMNQICSSSRGYRGERPGTVPGARLPRSDSTRDLGERFIGSWIVPCRAERVAASQSPGRQPTALDRPVSNDRLAGVVGTARQKATGSSKVLRKNELIERSTASIERAATPGSAGSPVESLTDASFQGATEFSFKGAQAGFE